jgi:hypothetical protein
MRFYWCFVLSVGLLVCAYDWSGFNKWHPAVFSPKPFAEVWWHFPSELGVVVGVFELMRRQSDDETG